MKDRGSHLRGIELTNEVVVPMMMMMMRMITGKYDSTFKSQYERLLSENFWKH